MAGDRAIGHRRGYGRVGGAYVGKSLAGWTSDGGGAYRFRDRLGLNHAAAAGGVG